VAVAAAEAVGDMDGALWWLMVATGVAAAALSIAAGWFDRRGGSRPTSRQRFLMHMASYALLSVSILVFAARGLLMDP